MASVTATDWQPEHKPRLTLAFCLYKYFPHGGLQRDFLSIALECQAKGHRVRVYTLNWHGDIPEGFDVTIVPVAALTNHTLYERFSEWVRRALVADPVDAVIGINKMPGLDVYYAADSCYEEKAHSQRGWWYRLLPRYHHFFPVRTCGVWAGFRHRDSHDLRGTKALLRPSLPDAGGTHDVPVARYCQGPDSSRQHH